MAFSTATAATAPPRSTALQVAGRMLRGALTVLLALVGLALAAMCLGRFAVLGAGSAAAPVWLGAAAAAEQLAGTALLGSQYALWDGFARALGLALLSSLSLGVSAWAWPRRRQLRRQPVPAPHVYVDAPPDVHASRAELVPAEPAPARGPGAGARGSVD